MDGWNAQLLPKRLRRARLARGLTQERLAEELDVSPSQVGRFERGEAEPDSSYLISIADALDTRTEALLRPRFVEVEKPDFRKKSRLKQREQKAVLAQVGEWIERYLDLESLVDQPSEFEVVRFEIGGFDDVEEAAVQLRQTWGLGLDPIDNLTEVLEDRGIRVCPVEADEDFDALAFWADEDIPVVAFRRGVPGDRQRFSMAHELGHIVLEPNGVEAEDAANRFAGAFLVPRQRARDELGDDRRSLNPHELHLLKHKYGLSMAGWIYRASDLDILSDDEAQSMWKLLARKGWREEEPGELFEPEEPTRLKRLVLRGLQEEMISPDRAAELLGMSLSDFQSSEARRHAGFPSSLRD